MAGSGIGWCFQVPVVTAQSTAAVSDLGMVLSMVYHPLQILSNLTSTSVQTLGCQFSSPRDSLPSITSPSSLFQRSRASIENLCWRRCYWARNAFSSNPLSEILVASVNGLRAAFIVAIIASSIAAVVSMGVRRTRLAESLSPTAV